MTEADWISCTDPQLMLKSLRGKASDRKLRLFACACCRTIWQMLSDERSRKAVDVSERFADGLADTLELNNARMDASAAYSFMGEKGDVKAAASAANAAHPDASRTYSGTYGSTPSEHAALLREVFNPFATPDTSRPDALSGVVRRLAKSIRDEQRFDDMPALADRLEETGVQDARLLAHCRQVGGHVRGCWVLDLLLGDPQTREAVTEDQWLTPNNLERMLEFVQKKASDRKLRLFACAVMRQEWEKLHDDESRQAVIVAEMFADGQATRKQLKKAEKAAERVASGHCDPALGEPVWNAVLTADGDARQFADAAQELATCDEGDDPEFTAYLNGLAQLLREIIGNPFQSVAVQHSWLTSKVSKLTKVIYDERAFSRMPELGQALEDAGCTNQDIIDHCRRPGEHVRGCWVVDLLTGKE